MTAATFDLLWVTLPILVLALVASIPRNEPPAFSERVVLGLSGSSSFPYRSIISLP